MQVVHLPNYDGLDRELPDADIFVGFSLRPEQFALTRKLRWIHSTAAAVGQLMYPELRASGIEVTNASGVHRVPMAEHILGTLIALGRRFPDCFRYQQQSRWAQQELWDGVPVALRPRELRGQTILFIGFGAIGREVAKIAQPLGVRIWAVTRSGKADTDLAERVFPASMLHEALPLADLVILAAPETPETTRMIGAPRICADEAFGLFRQRRARRAGGRVGADSHSRAAENCGRRDRCGFARTAAARKSPVESGQPVHHATC
jgi:D-2-hydroxyacid dehydrogenase (NADP+)